MQPEMKDLHERQKTEAPEAPTSSLVERVHVKSLDPPPETDFGFRTAGMTSILQGSLFHVLQLFLLLSFPIRY